MKFFESILVSFLKRSLLHSRYFVFLVYIFSSLNGLSQADELKTKLLSIPGITLTPLKNKHFKEYYEIMVSQQLDHTQAGKTFTQRFFLGIENPEAPVIFSTDGYAVDYASREDYSNELATELKANLLVVEHRFFGRSVPDSLTWKFLTVEQAAMDYHAIRKLLEPVLTGKWISTGISKGGQAALAYKLFYPQDVVATVVYGAAVKEKQSIKTSQLLTKLSDTECGLKIDALQKYLFQDKKKILPFFTDYAAQKKLNFSPLSEEAVLDYLLLELPLSFWQNGNSCSEIPDTLLSAPELFLYLAKIVPPAFFSATNRKKLEPAFYMFYHELGYYEYYTEPFKEQLSQADYSNQYFAPDLINMQFDEKFQLALKTYLKSKESETTFFIYGGLDPWALQSKVKKNKFVIKDGSHKSRISNLSTVEQKIFYDQIRACLR